MWGIARKKKHGGYAIDFRQKIIDASNVAENFKIYTEAMLEVLSYELEKKHFENALWIVSFFLLIMALHLSLLAQRVI